MTNSEQVAFNAMLRDCESRMFVPEQSIFKMIEVLFCETVLDVWLEIFNLDDAPTFTILRAEKDGVDVLGFIEILGGYTELVSVVEKKLKEENE